MKQIDIYIDGKGSTAKDEAQWIYYLNYKDCVIKRKGKCGDYTSHTATLQALINALSCVKEPCEINIYSKIELGFKNTKKSRNKLFILEIQRIVNEAGHVITFNIDKEFNKPKKWENENNTKQQKQQAAQRKQENMEKSSGPDDWRAMYSDLMGPSQGAWVPGSGGY